MSDITPTPEQPAQDEALRATLEKAAVYRSPDYITEDEAREALVREGATVIPVHEVPAEIFEPRVAGLETPSATDRPTRSRRPSDPGLGL